MNSTTKTQVDRATIEKVMHKHFGDVQVQNVTELTEGWFNAIFVIDYRKDNEDFSVVMKTGVKTGTYVLSYEKNLVKAELEVYDLLADTIIPTAKIYARDFDHDLIDCDFFIMERMMGDNWGHLADQISPENRDILIAEIAQYTATLHQIKGPWYGYLKENPFYQHSSWKDAFRGIIQMTIDDSKEQGLDLPYDDILETLAPYWDLLDDIQEPCLVHFDMWTKNIMLKQGEDGLYHIDAIVDLERCFYGDPYADFISSNTIVGDVSSCQIFMDNYSKISGKHFAFTQKDRVRQLMYFTYLILLGGAESYRQLDEAGKQEAVARCRGGLQVFAQQLKEAAAKL